MEMTCECTESVIHISILPESGRVIYTVKKLTVLSDGTVLPSSTSTIEYTLPEGSTFVEDLIAFMPEENSPMAGDIL
jgi:archaellum component FlaF (FlaF/FlaG flagellin family)